MTASSDSTAPFGLPGRLRMRDWPRTPHTARLGTANFVDLAPSARIRSAMPSSSRSQTARVASGVTSRLAIPVPPVVTTNRTWALRRTRISRMTASSSGTISRETTRKFFFSRTSATAGPPRSARSPREEESLTVTTAAVSSGVEEDIFFLSLFAATVAIRFVEQPQAFHQQALRVELGARLGRLAFEVQLEITSGPAQNLEHRLVALKIPVNRVHDLPLIEVNIALVVVARQRKQTTLAAHFERLHQVDHIHLREAPAQNPVRGRRFGHLLQRNLVDHALDTPRSFLQKERLFDEIVDRILLRETLCDVGLRGKNDRGEIRCRGPAAQLLDQLASIHSRHAVIGDQQIGGIVYGLEECIGRVACCVDLSQRCK